MMIKLEKGPLIMGPWSFSTFQVIHANTLRSGPFRGRERERERDLMYSGDLNIGCMKHLNSELLHVLYSNALYHE